MIHDFFTTLRSISEEAFFYTVPQARPIWAKEGERSGEEEPLEAVPLMVPPSGGLRLFHLLYWHRAAGGDDVLDFLAV